MQISFITLLMIDLYKDNLHACVHLLTFSLKKLLRNYLLDFYQIS